MRLIGNITEEPSTRRLVAFLLTQGIDSLAEKNGDTWDVWIKEEDDVDKAREIFDDFNEHPEDPRYLQAVQQANEMVKQAIEEKEKKRDNVIVMRGQWGKPVHHRKPLVVTIMIITVAVFMMTSGWKYGNFRNEFVSVEPSIVLKSLSFANPDETLRLFSEYIRKRALLESEEDVSNFSTSSVDPDANPADKIYEQIKKVEQKIAKLKRDAQNDIGSKMVNVSRGEVWRVFTPMFIHFGVLHLVLNMIWLNSLGGQFEHVYGTARFGLFVLAAAAVANLLQALMPTEWQGSSSVSLFGGMSGVNYALAGFIWMKTLFDPTRGLHLSAINMYILVIWMFMGILNNETMSMANWAHGGGLVFGMLIGYLPVLFKNGKES